MNLISQRLAAHGRARNVETVLKAESAANAVDRAMGALWAELRRRLRQDRHAVRDILHKFLPTALSTVDDSLRRMAAWANRETVQSLTDTLSPRYLRAAAIRSLFEAREVPLREDRNRIKKSLPPRPGIIQLALDALGAPKIVDLGALLREPVRDEFSPEQQEEIFSALLFPPPDQQTLDDILYQPVAGVTWFQRLENATRIEGATPEKLTEVIGRGFAQGQSVNEIERGLLPVLDNVRSSARRIARTESMRITGGIQEKTWEGLGDLEIGRQIHAQLDSATRPVHAARNGKIYYFNPKGGQPGPEQMPHPPLEADGSMAWN